MLIFQLDYFWCYRHTFVEYAGDDVIHEHDHGSAENETVCNLSIGDGARGGDEALTKNTFEINQGREFNSGCAAWIPPGIGKHLTDEGATFDKELNFELPQIENDDYLREQFLEWVSEFQVVYCPCEA